MPGQLSAFATQLHYVIVLWAVLCAIMTWYNFPGEVAFLWYHDHIQRWTFFAERGDKFVVWKLVSSEVTTLFHWPRFSDENFCRACVTTFSNFDWFSDEFFFACHMASLKVPTLLFYPTYAYTYPNLFSMMNFFPSEVTTLFDWFSDELIFPKGALSWQL